MTTEAECALTAKERLLREIELLPDELVAEALNFVAFIRARQDGLEVKSDGVSPSERHSTAGSLLEFAGSWVGNDIQDCLEEVRALRE